jgi:hypothetical protein
MNLSVSTYAFWDPADTRSNRTDRHANNHAVLVHANELNFSVPPGIALKTPSSSNFNFFGVLVRLLHRDCKLCVYRSLAECTR